MLHGVLMISQLHRRFLCVILSQPLNFNVFISGLFMGLFCILNNKLLRSLFVLIYAKNYVLLKNEFSQDMTQIHWADGR